MRVRKGLAFVLTAAVTLLTFAVPGAALAQAGGEADVSVPIEPAALLLLFEANYTPSPSLLDATYSLDLLSHPSVSGLSPTISFSQRAAWNQYSYWTLDLNLAATVPLYRSRAQPLAALHNEQRVQLALSAALAFEAARVGFIADVLALSRLRALSDYVVQVMESLVVSGWHPPDNVAAAFEVPTNQREAVAAYAQAAGLKRYLESALPELEARVAGSLGIEGAIELASFDQLAPTLVPAVPTLEQCEKNSPLLKEVHALHTVQRLELAAQQSLDLRIDLTGSASYNSGNPSAALGIEARLPLPNAWPVSGHLGAAADLYGAEQTLRLAWPAPPASLSRPLSEAERAERYTEQVGVVERELASMLSSVASSASSVLAAEAQLLWAIGDLLSVPDLTRARAAASSLTGDPLTDLYLTRLQSDLAFAQINHAEALLNAAAACGTGS